MPQTPRTSVPSVWDEIDRISTPTTPAPADDVWSAIDRLATPTPAAAPRPAVKGAPAGTAPGLLQPGNIDLSKRPVVKNFDGSISTVRSIGVNIDGREVLIPTVSDDGRVLSNQDAIAQYRKSGRHLGMFDSPASATAYAKQLHEAQAAAYGPAPTLATGPAATLDRIGYQPTPVNPTPLPVTPRLGSAKTGGMASSNPIGTMPILDAPGVGVRQMGQGAREIGSAMADTSAPAPSTEPMRRSRTGALYQPPPSIDPRVVKGTADILEGGMAASTPLLIGAGAAAPVETVAALAKGYAASKAAEAVAHKAGLSDDATRVVSAVSGGIAAGVPLRETIDKAIWSAADKTRAMADAADARRNPPPAVIPPEPTDIPVIPKRPALEADNLARGTVAPPAPPPAVPPADVWKAVDEATAPANPAGAVWQAVADVTSSEPRSAQGPTTASPAETPQPVAVRPGAGESVGPVAPSPEPSPVAPAVAQTSPLPEHVPIGEESAYTGIERRATTGTGPAGVERRAVNSDAPLDTTKPVAAAQQMLDENPKIIKQGADLGKRARESRMEAPPREAPAPEHADEDPFTTTLREARDQGFNGTDEDLRGRYDEAVANARQISREARQDTGGGQQLLADVAKYGGIRLDKDDPYHGEVAWLWEHGGKESQVNRTTKNGRAFSQRMPSARLGGVNGVLHQKKGLTLDHMAENLRQDPKYAHLEGPNELIEAIKESVTRIDRGLDRDIAPNLAPGWWKRPDDLVIRPGKGLSPDEETVATPFREAVAQRTPEMVSRYVERFGNVVDADKAKQLAGEGGHTPAFQAKYSTAVHPASSALAGAVYRHLLQQPTPEGKTPEVVFVTGPTGAGKGTIREYPAMREALKDSEIVVDGPMTQVYQSMTRVQMALDAGRSVSIIYVHRDPVEAWHQGVQARKLKEGRETGLDYHVTSHVEGLRTIKELANAYGDHPNVKIEVVRNQTDEEPASMEVGHLPEAYNEGDVRDAIEARRADTEGSTPAGAEQGAALGGDEGAERSVSRAPSGEGSPAPPEEVASKPDVWKQIDDAVGADTESKPRPPSKPSIPIASKPAERSVQEESYDNAAANAFKVAGDPEAATNNELERAAGYLSHRREARRHKLEKEGRDAKTDDVLAGIISEQGWYERILRERRQAKESKPSIPVTPKAAAPPEPKAPAADADEHAFTADNLQTVFGLSEDQAGATMALVKAMGLDASRLALARGAGLSPDTLQQILSAPPIFYSALARAVEAKMPTRASAEQILKIASNPQSGVKADELKWSGLEVWLKDQKGPVSKDAVLTFLHENQIRVDEVSLGEESPDLIKKRGEQLALSDEIDAARSKAFGAGRQGNEPGQIPTQTVGDIGQYAIAVAAKSVGWENAQRRIDGLGLSEEHKKDLLHYGELAWKSRELNDVVMDLRKPTKFAKYTLPGGENYRELLLTLPLPKRYEARKAVFAKHQPELTRIDNEITDLLYRRMEDGHRPSRSDEEIARIRPRMHELRAEREALESKRDAEAEAVGGPATYDDQYRGPHWDQPNVMVHLRINDRASADGKRVLFIEEIQSDWHQQGRKKGYKDETERQRLISELHDLEARWKRTPEGPENERLAGEKYALIDKINDLNDANTYGVANGPFKTTWHELAVKRALRYAADHGYDSIAWTTGDQQNERYDLSKHVKTVFAEPTGGGQFEVTIDNHDGDTVYDTARTGAITLKQIEDLIGKEMAEKIGALKEPHTFSGLDLKMGGKGMRGFYDDMLPRFLNKYAKPFGAKVGETQIEVGPEKSSTPRYVGPARSESEVTRAALKHERTYDNQDTLNGLISIAGRMQRGYTFTQAMEEAAEAWSPDDFAAVAEALGGKSEQTKTPTVAAVHALDITPEMRKGVLAGQPLFQKQQKSDLFENGEEQPRLPGDVGDAREKEVSTPEFERNDEFRLTPETSKRKGKQDSLFQAAYHGSPHKFEQFSLHHIGTGEGAQAYGWGLYFAGSRDVAEYYRKELSDRRGNGMPYESVTYKGRTYQPGEGIANDLYNVKTNGLRETILDYERAIRGNRTYAPDQAALQQAHLDRIRDIDPDDISVDKAGRTYKVDIPEDVDYLDWDLPASKQSPKVQAALRELGIEWEPVKPWTPARFMAWTESKAFDRLWREDIGIRESLQAGIKIAESGDKKAFENWYQKHQGMFPKGAVDPLGETIYNDLTWKSRPPADGGVGAAPRQKVASEKLAALGLAGIKYDDGMSRGKGSGSHNYVVFDDKLVQIMEFDQGAKGAVEFTDGGRAVIRALEAPDVSTAVHELAHVARRFLFDRNLPPKERAGISDEDIATAEQWAGAPDGVWSREAEEKFARGFEGYLHDGSAPTSKLRALFDKLKAWLRDIYKQLKGSAIDIDISPSMRKVFDKLMSRGEIPVKPRPTEGGQTLQSAVIPGAKEFVEQDVAPAVREAAEKVDAARQDIRAAFAPDTVGDAAKMTASALRANLAARDLRIQRAQKALRSAEKALDRRSDADNLDLMYAIEEDKIGSLPKAMRPIAESLRDILDAKRAQVQARGKLENYIENYFPHEWKQPSKAKNLLSRLLGRKPLQGPRSFLKQRSIPTVREGVDLGLTPADPNPVRLVLHKLAEMDKWSMAYDVLHDWKSLGVATFVRAGDQAPEGWRRYHDSFGTVYGKSDDGATTIRGHYYGPPDAVRILDNHLSPGLRGNAAFDLYRAAGNMLNQVQLGLSAFHITMTGIEAMVSKLAQGIEEVSRGEFGYAGKSFAEAPVATFTTLWKGNKALKALYAADPNMAEVLSVADKVAQGGGGVSRDKTMRAYEDRVENLMRAFRQGNYPGVLGRSIAAAFELPTKFIMEWWVPRLKLGAYLDMAEMELRTLGPKPSIPDARRVLAGVWDSIDNRFGQLVYDNLFWNNAMKDAGMASVRALGWNVGTVREVFGSPSGQFKHLKDRPIRMRDTGRSKDLLGEEPIYEARKDPWLTHKAAYTLAMTFGVAMLGALYQYLHTGEGPKEARDLFFPRTGKKKPDGRAERVSFPSYFKDVYAVFHAMPGSVVETASHKLNPMLNVLADLWKNEDYFGTEIRNPDDPVVQQAKEVARYLGETVTPMSVRSYQQRKEDKGSTGVGSVESFFGVTPAPASVYRSKAEDLMRQYLPSGHRTQRQADAREAAGEIRDAVRTGGAGGKAEAREALKPGLLTPRQVQAAARGAEMTPLQAGFQRLSLEQALSVYRVASAGERATLRMLLMKKAESWSTNAAPADVDRLRVSVMEALKLPWHAPIPVTSRQPVTSK